MAVTSQLVDVACSSVAAAKARNSVTNGVAIPSLSPLSTFSARRIRTGTFGSLKIGRPNAASVGARMAAMSAAKARPSPRSTIRATIVPSRIVSGMPIASSRPGSLASPRTLLKSTVEASANRRSARVSSTSILTGSVPGCRGSSPRPPGPRARPRTTNTIGIVTDQRPSLSAKAAYNTIATVKTASPVVMRASPGAWWNEYQPTRMTCCAVAGTIIPG